jgi:hypothetical protein
LEEVICCVSCYRVNFDVLFNHSLELGEKKYFYGFGKEANRERGIFNKLK